MNKPNIVIGGMGEAEVNPDWSPTFAIQELYRVAEECGYFVTKGKWSPVYKEIFISTHAEFILAYWKDELKSIHKIVKVAQWIRPDQDCNQLPKYEDMGAGK